MTTLGTVGAVTVLDDVASVGPVKHTRLKVVGDANYITAAGGSLGLADAINKAVGENRTYVAINPTGPNADRRPDYTPKGKELACSVTPATPLFSTGSIPHGLASGTPVKFLTDDVGNDNNPQPKLPTGLVAGTVYYVIATGLTTTAFEVSATIGGSSIAALTDAGGQFEVQAQDQLEIWDVDGNAEFGSGDDSGNTYTLYAVGY
jgi:hypothetical protein